MKLSIKRDISVDRLKARERINRSYFERVNFMLGAGSQLYQLKAMLASVGNDTLGDPEEIEAKVIETAARIKPLDDTKQAVQARIDNATNALEIDAIVEEYLNAN